MEDYLYIATKQIKSSFSISDSLGKTALRDTILFLQTIYDDGEQLRDYVRILLKNVNYTCIYI